VSLEERGPILLGRSGSMLFRSIEMCSGLCPSFIPIDYGKDFLLYLAAKESTIGMVLDQEDDVLEEHFIYYLSGGLVGPKLN
jgi:hypothetical protein